MAGKYALRALLMRTHISRKAKRTSGQRHHHGWVAMGVSTSSARPHRRSSKLTSTPTPRCTSSAWAWQRQQQKTPLLLLWHLPRKMQRRAYGDDFFKALVFLAYNSPPVGEISVQSFVGLWSEAGHTLGQSPANRGSVLDRLDIRTKHTILK